MINYKLKHTITTTVDNDGLIVQNIHDELLNKYTQNVINTQDNEVRKALIELGWEPPQNHSLVYERIINDSDWLYGISQIDNAVFQTIGDGSVALVKVFKLNK